MQRAHPPLPNSARSGTRARVKLVEVRAIDGRADKFDCGAERTAIQAASTDQARATGPGGVLGTHKRTGVGCAPSGGTRRLLRSPRRSHEQSPDRRRSQAPACGTVQPTRTRGRRERVWNRPLRPQHSKARSGWALWFPRRTSCDVVRDSSSNPVVYAELPGALHSFDLFHSIRFENVVDGIEAFAAWVRSRRPAVRDSLCPPGTPPGLAVRDPAARG
jgi:hypothetical protein